MMGKFVKLMQFLKSYKLIRNQAQSISYGMDYK